MNYITAFSFDPKFLMSSRVGFSTEGASHYQDEIFNTIYSILESKSISDNCYSIRVESHDFYSLI